MDNTSTIYKYNKIKKNIISGYIVIIIFTLIIIGVSILKLKSENDINNNCNFYGKMVQGAEYINGDYTYRYMQQKSDRYIVFNKGEKWENIDEEGWGVILSDISSEEPITSKLCSTINNKPVISMQGMFHHASNETIDFSDYDTSSVTNMAYMFYDSYIDNLNLSSFDTSNVINMRMMFTDSTSKIINLSSFDTSKVLDMNNMFSHTSVENLDISNFDTSNVRDMSMMFSEIDVPTLDLSSFDINNVTNMKSMFQYNKINTCYVKSQEDINKFKNTLEEGNKINFIMK